MCPTPTRRAFARFASDGRRPPPFRGRRFRHAVDWLLANERIGAGLDIEGEQLVGGLAFETHGSHPAIVIALNS